MRKIIFIALLLLSSLSLYAVAPKISFVPFTNANGDASFDQYTFDVQDSLQKQFIAGNADGNYEVIPFEQITAQLQEKEIAPDNAQYETYMWQIAEELGVKYIISGNFLNQAGKFIINTYIYDVSMKMPITTHQAKDIFVPQDNILRAVKPIFNRLKPFFETLNG